MGLHHARRRRVDAARAHRRRRRAPRRAPSRSAAQPTVFYSDATTGSLRVAWRSGGSWRLETLDGPGSTLAGHTGDHVGAAVSAVVVAGEPGVFYSDATSASVRYARRTGSGWQLETLDGPGSDLSQHTWHHVGSRVSALVADGKPQVYYYDATAGSDAPRLVERRPLVVPDHRRANLAAGRAHRRPGRVRDQRDALGGQPQVFYADASPPSLRHAPLTASGWRFATLDGAGVHAAPGTPPTASGRRSGSPR